MGVIGGNLDISFGFDTNNVFISAMGYFYAQGSTRDMKEDSSFNKRKAFFLKEGTKNEYRQNSFDTFSRILRAGPF